MFGLSYIYLAPMDHQGSNWCFLALKSTSINLSRTTFRLLSSDIESGNPRNFLVCIVVYRKEVQLIDVKLKILSVFTAPQSIHQTYLFVQMTRVLFDD